MLLYSAAKGSNEVLLLSIGFEGTLQFIKNYKIQDRKYIGPVSYEHAVACKLWLSFNTPTISFAKPNED